MVNKLEIVSINRCPICKSSAGTVLLQDLQDDIARAPMFPAQLIQCDNCGSGFLTKSLSNDCLSRAYEGYYTQSSSGIDEKLFMGDRRFANLRGFYERKYSGNGTILWRFLDLPPFNFFFNRAVRFLPSGHTHEQQKLLDIGCGNGQFLYRAKDLGFDVTGVDFDKHAVSQANKLNLNVQLGSLEDIDTSDRFDCITASHVIEHVRDPNTFLDIILDRLEEGGYFYLSTPNFASAGRTIFGRKWRGIDFPRHLHFFTHAGLYDLLKQKGFSRIEAVNDLAQSLSIFRASIALSQRDERVSLLKKIFLYLKFLRANVFPVKNSEVIVFRCWK